MSVVPSPVLSVAPMMDRTDRHYRVFMRALTKKTLLYSEMITTGAILHGKRDRMLAFDPVEHPIALQLGGDDPTALAQCARIGQEAGYDEINLNVGCPSDRVSSGCFGAALMARPERVADCVAAMCASVSLPVTVKHRIGIIGHEQIGDAEAMAGDYQRLFDFVRLVSEAGSARMSVHARVAVLGGFSPKDNREIPPLRHDLVARIKRDCPHLVIETNGGIATIDAIRQQLQQVDAVMIGRAAYDNPLLFATVDTDFFGQPRIALTRRQVIASLYDYIDRMCAVGVSPHRTTRHLLGLFAGVRGAKAWRRGLRPEVAKYAETAGAFLDPLVASLPQDVLDASVTDDVRGA